MANKSNVIYLKNNGSLDAQRDAVANELRARGYAVDAFARVVCVNGYRLENDGLQMLTESQANEAISPYREQKSDSIMGCIRIDVVWSEELSQE